MNTTHAPAASPQPCDCTVHCGDDPWLKDGQARPCQRELQRQQLQAATRIELLTWHLLPGGRLPDSDITVLMELLPPAMAASPTATEVWQGWWHHAEQAWHDATTGGPLAQGTVVVAWADPKGSRG